MSFDAPFMLALAPLVALAFAGAAWFARRRRIELARAWSADLAREAAGRGGWAPAVVGIAVLFALVALAGPRWGRTEVTTETQALNLAIAVDISRSMLAEDVEPSRLGQAVREAKRLVQDLTGDRIGLIAFAGNSYILAPLTVDQSAVLMYLDALDPEIASEGGTNLSAVLAQGRQLLSLSDSPADRVLLILTDGEAHDSLAEAKERAEALEASGIRVIVAAVGSDEPTRIPVRDSTGRLIAYQRDANGSVIFTRREDATLRQVVEAADGTFVPANIPDQAGAIRELLATLQRSPMSETRTANLVPRAWLPALLSAFLLLALTFTRRTASLIAVGGTAVLFQAACLQPPNAAQRALAAGRPERAAAAFLEHARAGEAPDTSFYNAGTAALQAERWDVARGALTEAAESLDPELRYRALYNAGTAALTQAGADTAARTALLAQAVDQLKEALLLEPGSERAKWNLELAQRLLPQGGGGGGAPTSSSGGGGEQARPPASDAAGPGLTRSQAEQILNSIEREERETRTAQIQRRQGGGRGVRDW